MIQPILYPQAAWAKLQNTTCNFQRHLATDNFFGELLKKNSKNFRFSTKIGCFININWTLNL